MFTGSSIDCLDRARRLAAASALVGSIAVLGACAPVPPVHTAKTRTAPTTNTATTTPADPRDWVGRWHGAGAAALRIMPSTAGRGYKLILRSAQGITTHYRATATDDRLIFDRGARTLAIRPGHGAETGEPALANLTECLIVVPGRQGYCRHGNTADALPLARGAYVTVRTDCRAARTTGTLYFDGRSLTRPGQNACRAAVVNQEGVIFHLSDSCAVGSGDDASAGADETITVPDAHHLSLHTTGRSTRLYRYCASGLLPLDLQSQARR